MGAANAQSSILGGGPKVGRLKACRTNLFFDFREYLGIHVMCRRVVELHEDLHEPLQNLPKMVQSASKSD